MFNLKVRYVLNVLNFPCFSLTQKYWHKLTERSRTELSPEENPYIVLGQLDFHMKTIQFDFCLTLSTKINYLSGL
jgi:hypothetical protein